MIFPFDPDIRRASTIPARLYVDPVYLELERERVFAHTWQFAARRNRSAETGSFFTARDRQRVRSSSLRDGDTLRGFYNVCLHRAGTRRARVRQATDAAVQVSRMDLHARRASCCARRRWTASSVSRRTTCGLRPVAVATWGPLVFVESRRHGPAARRNARGHSRIAWRRSTASRCATSCARSTSSPATGRSTSTTTSRDITSPWCTRRCTRRSTTTATASSRSAIRRFSTRRSGRRCGRRPLNGSTIRPRPKVAEAVYGWLFPNIMLNVYLGQMQTNVVLPRVARSHAW